MKNKNIIFPIILIIGILTLLINDMGIITWYKLKNEKKYLKKEIDQLITKEKILTKEIDLLKNNNDYIIKIAKERFHMANPGEKIFRVVDKRNIKIKNTTSP